jgi:hypothetical protein
MREDVFAATIRRNEAETLGVVEPLYGTSCHERVILTCTIEESGKYPSGRGSSQHCWSN